MPDPTPEQFVAAALAVHRHYRHLDHGDYDAVVAQIAPDASIERGPGEYVTGPDGMRESMNRRNPKRSTAHIPAAPVVEALSDDHLRVSYVITAWVRMQQEGTPPSFDVDPSALLGIVDAVDELVRIDGEWLFSRRRYAAALR